MPPSPDGLDPDRRQLLATVARWYYLEQASQLEISRRLETSRSTVSRLLTEARVEGVIEVRINAESPLDDALAEDLSRTLQVPVVVVVRDEDPAYVLGAMGRSAARLAEGFLHPGCTMAISYGTSVYETVKATKTHQFPGLQIVQMAGVEGVRNPLIDGWELVRMCADRLGGDYHFLHAPLFVKNESLHEALTEDLENRKLLDMAASADVAVVGIGSMTASRSSLVRAGHLTSDDLRRCQEQGSVGYICGQHYDRDGAPMDALNRRTISLPLDRLSGIKNVIAVAGGRDKAPGILGAANGGYLQALVTDVEAATAMVD